MLKTITFAVGFAVSVVHPFQIAYAGECTPALWSRVLTNLNATMSDAGMKGCAFAKIHGGTKAYEAFADCNRAFRDGGLLNPLQNDYVDCAPNVCNWFKSERLDPSC